MTTANIVFGIILIVAALALTICVLLQHGKSHNLSGTIAGGAETFFGKSKGETVDKKLNTVTTVLAIVFVLIVLAAFFVQNKSADTSGRISEGGAVTEAVTAAVTGDATAAATEAPATEAPATEAPATETTAA